MSKIIKILDEFDNRELSFFYKYQGDNYSNETNSLIENYIFNNRKLTLNDIDKNTSAKAYKSIILSEEKCPRCYTNKIRRDSIKWQIPIFHAGAEDEYASLYEIQTGKDYMKEKITCNVCGYVLKDPNNRSFKEKVLGIFFDNWLWTFIIKTFKNEY